MVPLPDISEFEWPVKEALWQRGSTLRSRIQSIEMLVPIDIRS